jgi:hypothetical protein
LTKLPFSLEFDHNDFSTLDGDSLFKLVARAHINESNKNVSDIAVKYQVLSKETAFIGVIKQDEKVIGEIEKVSIEPIFGPKKVQSVSSSANHYNTSYKSTFMSSNIRMKTLSLKSDNVA